jgi:competence protein ComEC
MTTLLDTLQRWSLRSPLLAPALGLWVGAVAMGEWSWVRLAGLAGAGLLLCLLPGLRRASLLWWLAAGAGTGGLCRRLERESVRCPPPGVEARAVARLQWLEAEPDGRVSAALELRAAETDGGFAPLRCPVLVSTGRRSPAAEEGDWVYLPAVAFEPPAHLVNPGSGDSSAALAAEGIERVGSLADGAGLVVLERARGPAAALARLRRRFAAAVALALPAGEARATLLAAVLGDRAELEAAARDRNLETGLSHLTSPSGLYLALLLWCTRNLLKRLWSLSERLALRLPAGRAADILCLPLPWVWASLAGERGAAVRAAGIGTAWLAARALGRGRPTGLHLWSAAALVAFGLWPSEALDPSLWLLALLLLGLWALGPSLARWLGGEPGPGLIRRLRGLGGSALAFALAGWVAALPYAAWQAHRLSALSLPAQLLALPIAGALTLSSWAALAVFLLHAGWERPLLLFAHGCARGFVALAAWAAAPGARLVTPSLPWSLWLALLVLVAALAASLRGVQPARAVAGLAALIFAVGLPLSRWRAAGLRITFLSVGQGDSTVLELPQGGVVVVDAGGSAVGSFDPGRRVVAPYLWSRGVDRLTAAVLTHPHPDHANGLPFLLDSFEVGELWSTQEPCPLPACDEISRLLGERHVPRRLFSPEAHSLELDGVRFDALYPLAPEGYYPELLPNDNSLVLRVRYGDFTLLLPGDIEAEAEARLTAEAGLDLSADVLKAPHHGSDTSSGEELVRRVHPKAVVFCVGPHNRFGFPKPAVVARWRMAGARTYRTDDDGAVTFETTGRGFQVHTERIPDAPGAVSE